LTGSGRWEKDVANTSSIVIVLNDTRVTTHEIVMKFLNGQYAHKDGNKAGWLDTCGAPRELLRNEFLRIIHHLAPVYWVGHNVIEPILTTPSLIRNRR
jgi:hypothetical protein